MWRSCVMGLLFFWVVLDFEFLPYLSELAVDVCSYAEDGTGIDETLAEEPEDGVGDFACWGDDESCHGKCDSDCEHCDG